MDSELFGHEKGAFTGAISRKHGRFERASGGTIFLDEVGELSKDAQVRLLRVLQEKEIERVGGTETIEVDIRLIAATHRNISQMVKEGKFREDLFFRLNVFPIKIPALKDRIDDIPSLADYFLQKKAKEMKLLNIPKLSPGAIERLRAYHWPGNIRELENAIERALILCEEDLLTFDELEQRGAPETPQKQSEMEIPEDLNYERTTFRLYQKALKKAGGKVEGPGGAAELLGLNPRTLRCRMRKLNVPFGRAASLQW